ncbi:hypothetical protein ABTK08_20465, partial [Acinetobacter baumannii]
MPTPILPKKPLPRFPAPRHAPPALSPGLMAAGLSLRAALLDQGPQRIARGKQHRQTGANTPGLVGEVPAAHPAGHDDIGE